MPVEGKVHLHCILYNKWMDTVVYFVGNLISLQASATKMKLALHAPIHIHIPLSEKISLHEIISHGLFIM